MRPRDFYILMHKVNGPITDHVPIINRNSIRSGPITDDVPITDRNAFWGHFSLKTLAKDVFT